MTEPTRIVVVVEDGLVQQVLTMGLPCEVVIVDYDVEGCDVADLSSLDGDDCWLSNWTADDSDRGFVERAFDAAREA